jgi:iron complex outermembrane receptor protein
LDKNPPLVGSNYASNGNTYAGFYDTLGRYVFAGISIKY